MSRWSDSPGGLSNAGGTGGGGVGHGLQGGTIRGGVNKNRGGKVQAQYQGVNWQNPFGTLEAARGIPATPSSSASGSSAASGGVSGIIDSLFSGASTAGSYVSGLANSIGQGLEGLTQDISNLDVSATANSAFNSISTSVGNLFSFDNSKAKSPGQTYSLEPNFGHFDESNIGSLNLDMTASNMPRKVTRDEAFNYYEDIFHRDQNVSSVLSAFFEPGFRSMSSMENKLFDTGFKFAQRFGASLSTGNALMDKGMFGVVKVGSARADLGYSGIDRLVEYGMPRAEAEEMFGEWNRYDLGESREFNSGGNGDSPNVNTARQSGRGGYYPGYGYYSPGGGSTSAVGSVGANTFGAAYTRRGVEGTATRPDGGLVLFDQMVAESELSDLLKSVKSDEDEDDKAKKELDLLLGTLE
jgi:hypothetical protein